MYDGAAVGGLRYLREDGLGWDLSASVGRSRIDQFLRRPVTGPGPTWPPAWTASIGEPGERWTIGSALRFERFADFGATVNGKLAGRIGLPAQLALRAAVSTGFRAPTPGQQHAFNVTTAFLGGELVNRGVVPPTSAVAVARGGRQLEPERSVH